jgi:hypothetical protein
MLVGKKKCQIIFIIYEEVKLYRKKYCRKINSFIESFHFIMQWNRDRSNLDKCALDTVGQETIKPQWMSSVYRWITARRDFRLKKKINVNRITIDLVLPIFGDELYASPMVAKFFFRGSFILTTHLITMC